MRPCKIILLLISVILCALYFGVIGYKIGYSDGKFVSDMASYLIIKEKESHERQENQSS